MSTSYISDLAFWEGNSSTLYRDTEGYATCGIGNLVHDAEESQKLPWLRGGDRTLAATPEEITKDFHRVMAMPKGMPAGRYATATAPCLSGTAINHLAQRRLDTEFLPAIRRLMPGFDAFPAGPRSALVDIAWNVGAHGLGKFVKLVEACNKGDWWVAALECHRKTSRKERNAWAERAFLSAVIGGELTT